MTDILVEGKNGIYAKVLAHSKSVHSGTEMITFEVNFPRIILAELNTHRMLSKNIQSSRAVTVKKMIDMVRNTPFVPVWFGENQKGMSAAKEVEHIERAKELWLECAEDAIGSAVELNLMSLHKQITNRVLEPFTMTRGVISGTDWNNFLRLRRHKDAQPEIYELADCIERAKSQSKPQLLKHGEWHVPYVKTERNRFGKLCYFDEQGNEVSLEMALKISASCCAQVSYRVLNQSVEKAEDLHDRLIGSELGHWSPLEHQATPMTAWTWCLRNFASLLIQDEICLYKGNLRGFESYRKKFQNENLEFYGKVVVS